MSGPFDRTVLWLTYRQLFAKRRLYLAIAFSLLPLLFTIFYKFAADDREGARLDFFNGLSRDIIIGTLVPLAAAVFGTTAFGGEVDDGTLVYLLVKPIARWRILLSKYVVAVLCTICVMIPALALPYFLLQAPELPTSILVGYIAGGAVGASVYCAMFLLIGLVSRRALVMSLLYVIGFEEVLSHNLTGVKSLSVREFSIAISRAASQGSIVIKDFVVPITTSWTMSAIFLSASLLYGLWRLSRYEMQERL